MLDLVIFGAGGQLGAELVKAGRAQGRTVVSLAHGDVDISRAEDVAQAFDAVQARSSNSIVLNAAAYTAVDRAETQPEAAHAVNGRGAGLLASHCAALEMPLVHFSTDYVFDGTARRPYAEEDATRPLNVYGASKLAGEAAVRAACPRHVILRCASVFGAHGQNFPRTMLRLGRERRVLRVVADQVSCPTAATDLAGAALSLVSQLEMRPHSMPFGTYHFCGIPAVSWFEFAEAIFDAAAPYGVAAPELEAIAAADYPSAAKRPGYSVLDCTKISRAFGIVAPDWRAALKGMMDQLLGEGG